MKLRINRIIISALIVFALAYIAVRAMGGKASVNATAISLPESTPDTFPDEIRYFLSLVPSANDPITGWTERDFREMAACISREMGFRGVPEGIRQIATPAYIYRAHRRQDDIAEYETEAEEYETDIAEFALTLDEMTEKYILKPTDEAREGLDILLDEIPIAPDDPGKLTDTEEDFLWNLQAAVSVGWVIRNRLEDKDTWGDDTVNSVIHRDGQFTVVNRSFADHADGILESGDVKDYFGKLAAAYVLTGCDEYRLPQGVQAFKAGDSQRWAGHVKYGRWGNTFYWW